MTEQLSPDLDVAMVAVLRERMAARGVSGVALAAAVGIPQPTLQRRLAHGNARGTVFALREWDAIAAALGYELEDMLDAARVLLRSGASLKFE